MSATSTKRKQVRKQRVRKVNFHSENKSCERVTSIEEKLDALYNLQKIDSEIDQLELLEENYLLRLRIWKMKLLDSRPEQSTQSEIDEITEDISNRKLASKESEAAILKYKERQKQCSK